MLGLACSLLQVHQVALFTTTLEVKENLMQRLPPFLLIF